MYQADSSFLPAEGLQRAVDLLRAPPSECTALPSGMPLEPLGEERVLEMLAPHVLGKAARLGSTVAIANMDPPTPWISWAMAMWNASLNQNMLHDVTSPFGQVAEAKVLSWLMPHFGMSGGHFCAGSSVANLTGLWAARDAGGVREVVCSEAAHVSIEKACRLLGLKMIRVPVSGAGRVDVGQLPDLKQACLVLTAGTTSTGAIDPLGLATSAKWTHVDAAWAGALRLSPLYAVELAGIEKADSIAVSAHKWFFQAKDSAIVFFRDAEAANATIGFGSGGYLAKPNIGIQGSRSAAAIPLLATLMAWGHRGMAQRLEHLMDSAYLMAQQLEESGLFEFFGPPVTGINVFRPLYVDARSFMQALPAGMFSTCQLDSGLWVRAVPANPCADFELIVQLALAAARGENLVSLKARNVDR
jgi:L-2,4-diaminobutyrate decarboxylase